MLIIGRKAGEAVLIGDSIELRVVEVAGGRVTLGISAPPEILILREEIRLAGAQNRAAAQSASSAELKSLVARLGSGSKLNSRKPGSLR